MKEHRAAEMMPTQERPTAEIESREKTLRPYGVLIPFVVIAVLAIYASPFIATWRDVETTQLPMLFGSDLYFYLNIGNLKPVSPGVALNPWYDVSVSTRAIAYTRFGIVIAAFSRFSHFVGDTTSAHFLWMLSFVLMICAASLWLFHRLLPEKGSLVVSFSLALLLLLDLQTAADWIHIHSLNDLAKIYIPLPYMRTFFPQVGIPLLLGYIGLQLEALQKPSWKPWTIMAALQLLGILTFPYVTLLMALTTGVLLVVAYAFRKVQMPLRYVVLFGILCGIVDGGYAFLAGSPMGGAQSGSIVGFDLPLFRVLLLSKSVLTVLGCTLVVITIKPGDEKQAKWVVVSLGLGYVLLYLADALLSPTFQISHHAGYLTQTVLSIEVSFLAASIYYVLVPKVRWLRHVAALAIAILLLQGATTAYGMYRFFIPVNAANMEAARIIQTLKLGPDDLVIARAKMTDDPATWLPLVSVSQVLFCKNAELLLPVEDMPVHEYRKALYLFLTGHDSAWAERLLVQRPVSEELWQDLSLIRQRPFLTGSQRDQVLRNIRQEMVPLLDRVQNPDHVDLLRKYHRILVLDRLDKPSFSRERLLKYLKIKDEKQMGRYDLLWAEGLSDGMILDQNNTTRHLPAHVPNQARQRPKSLYLSRRRGRDPRPAASTP